VGLLHRPVEDTPVLGGREPGAGPGRIREEWMMWQLRLHLGRGLAPLVFAAVLVSAGLTSCDSAPVSAAETAEAAGRKVTAYQVVHGWPDLPPGEILGQATGVGVDSHGNVAWFRCGPSLRHCSRSGREGVHRRRW
jgi:hypothetical protein